MKEIRCTNDINIRGQWQKCNKRLMFFVFGDAEIITKCPKCKTEFNLKFNDDKAVMTKKT